VVHVQRSTVVRCLLAHDERELVERVPSMTDEELKRIGERADYYAFSSEDAMPTTAWEPLEQSHLQQSMCWRALRAS
jgi:hypothetical protein